MKDGLKEYQTPADYTSISTFWNLEQTKQKGVHHVF